MVLVPIGAMPVHGEIEAGRHLTDLRYALRDSGEQDDSGVQCLQHSSVILVSGDRESHDQPVNTIKDPNAPQSRLKVV